MNKLVTKNPVQRFKQGKKIQKMQNGGKPWAGYYTVGNWPRTQTQIKSNSFTQTPENGTYYEKTEGGKVIERGYWQNGKQIPLKNIQSSPVKTITVQKTLPEIIVIGNKSRNQDKLEEKNIQSPSFKNAFNQARNSGLKEFTWKGKRYTTKKKGEESYSWNNGWKPITNLQQENQVILNRDNNVPLSEVAPENLTIEGAMQSLPTTLNIPVRVNNLNRSNIRTIIRNGGFNPYNYTGQQRRALRNYLNGQSNDTSLLDGTDLARFTLPFRLQ